MLHSCGREHAGLTKFYMNSTARLCTCIFLKGGIYKGIRCLASNSIVPTKARLLRGKEEAGSRVNRLQSLLPKSTLPTKFPISPLTENTNEETKLQLSNLACLPKEESMTTRLAFSHKCTNSRVFFSL